MPNRQELESDLSAAEKDVTDITNKLTQAYQRANALRWQIHKQVEEELKVKENK